MSREGKARVLNEQEFKRLLIIAKDSPFALRNIAITKSVSRLAGHAHIAITSEYVEDNPNRLKRISRMAIF